MLKGHDAILAVDVGGSNIRAGIVELNLAKSADLSKARRGSTSSSGATRRRGREARRRGGVERRRRQDELAPVIGVGCPGVIHEDGSIARGAQNLPGNWESSRFNLPASIPERVPTSAPTRRWW